ncbi:MAG: hypothetical protein PHY19_04455 [Methanocellales archaeon]|nr:hypothetical protein [Methanocellales archaeon]
MGTNAILGGMRCHLFYYVRSRADRGVNRGQRRYIQLCTAGEMKDMHDVFIIGASHGGSISARIA